MTDKPNGSKMLNSLSTIIALLVVFGATCAFVVKTSYDASAAAAKAEKLETRVNCLEATIPRIDEKLSNIEKLLERHMDEKESKKP